MYTCNCLILEILNIELANNVFVYGGNKKNVVNTHRHIFNADFL